MYTPRLHTPVSDSCFHTNQTIQGCSDPTARTIRHELAIHMSQKSLPTRGPIPCTEPHARYPSSWTRPIAKPQSVVLTRPSSSSPSNQRETHTRTHDLAQTLAMMPAQLDLSCSHKHEGLSRRACHVMVPGWVASEASSLAEKGSLVAQNRDMQL